MSASLVNNNKVLFDSVFQQTIFFVFLWTIYLTDTYVKKREMGKRKCLFTSDLQSQYAASFRKGRNDNEALCTVCPPGTYISVAHSGKTDLDNHVASKKHKYNVGAASTSGTVTSYFASTGTPEQEKIAAAEAVMAFHTIKHHQSYSSLDCTAQIQRKIFDDSSIAKKITCGRTKAEAIVNAVLSVHSVDVVIDTLQGIAYFGVSTDSSNHGAEKIFPLLIQYFDWKQGGLQCKLIELQSLPNETSDTIATYVEQTLKNKGIADKCIAFGGDNTNSNFGGVNRRSGQNVYTKLKSSLKIGNSLLGVGCPAHIMHNTLSHASDVFPVDIESIVLKIFNYFSIYTVRTESLKEFCQFVEVSYKKLLRHSSTRWLSLFPATERILYLFEGLKSYFLSQEKPPVILKTFFENELSEGYLWFLHSIMSVFQTAILSMEREHNSLLETMIIITELKTMLLERKESQFLTLKVKNILSNRDSHEAKTFKDNAVAFYEQCIEYLDMWTVSFEDFSSFKWMSLTSVPSWSEVELTVDNLNKKNCVILDDNLLFNQYTKLKNFVGKKEQELDSTFKTKLSHEKWVDFFTDCVAPEQCSELLKLAEYFFAIPSHNANVERVFSLMNIQWSDERNRLLVESVKAIITTQYNFKNVTCSQFHEYVKKNKSLLKAIQSSEKYK